MNKYIKTLLVMAGGVLAACTNDDGNTNDGKTPLTLTAAGITAPTVTRATVDGTWEGTAKVSVRIGNDTYEYTVTPSADKTKAKLTQSSGDIVYYEDVKGQPIRAWAPSGTEWDSYTEDQSAIYKYKASDFLLAETTIDNANLALEFKHQTAKIHVTLKNAVGGDYIPNNPVKFNPTITVGNMSITPYKPDYNKYEYFALAKGASEARPFKVQFTPEETEFVFDGGTRTFEAGKQYDFELRVGKEGLILSGCTIKGWDEKTGGELNRIDYEVIDGVYHVYTEAGLKAWAEAVKASQHKDVNCTLESDITMPAVTEGKSNWTPVGTFKGTFDGNGHTISDLIINGGGYQAFIGILEYGGIVKNLTFKNISVTSTLMLSGAVAGDCDHGTIYGCQVIGGSVTSSGNMIGGIAGHLGNGGVIYACSATCNLAGNYRIGGIVGLCEDSQIIACWTNCTFGDGGSVKGAIVGSCLSSEFATITDCYYKNNGIGDTNATEVTGIGETTWHFAYNAMNTAIKDMEHDYVWDRNYDDATKNKVPLVLVKKKSTN